MSRVGKSPVVVPSGVTCEIKGQTVNISGPKGKLEKTFNQAVSIILEDFEGKKIIRIQANNDSRFSNMMTGTARSIIQSMVNGVLENYRKDLIIEGVGFRTELKGNVLNLSLGYSHGISYSIPAGITVRPEGNSLIAIEGPDKHMVGQVAAAIKQFRPVEPYKGKGIRIRGEFVVRKEGKKNAK